MAETLKEKYDVIVVGTGPGGAMTAKCLAERGKKVLMLEWGGGAAVKGAKTQGLSYFAELNKSVYFTNEMVMLVRAITVGGGSIVFHATASEPPYKLFDKYGIDLRDEIAEVKTEVPVAPLKDELIGPMAKIIAASARDLGYDWKPLNKFVYQDKCRPNCGKCSLGCPYGAKWNARMLVRTALENGAALLDYAKVDRIIVENKKATGVAFTRKGRKLIAQADKVVLAAGGIGSPIILQNSGIAEAGSNFFYDPFITVFGTARDMAGGAEFPMAMGAEFPEEGYSITDMTLPWMIYEIFAARAGRIDKLASHSRQLTIMVKARDGLGGRITTGGSIRKPLTAAEKWKLMTGYDRARKILRNAGAVDIFKSWWMASHPGGTCKISEIVDSNLKTRYDNLYVCDCSVIPEEWGRPPVLSLLGLGKRLAGHLGGRKAGR